MATLTAPHRAIGFKKGEPGKRKMPKRGKYHLMKADGDPSCEGMTACNLIVWSEGEFVEREGTWEGTPMFAGSRDDAYEIPLISEIPADRLCKKCLGPLHAED